ncbi:Peptidase A2 domain-containing protein, partial [Meloidogyne graminicola]
MLFQLLFIIIALKLSLVPGSFGEYCNDKFGGYCLNDNIRGCCVHGYPLCCEKGHSNCIPRFGGNMTQKCGNKDRICKEGQVCMFITKELEKCVPNEILQCNKYIELEKKINCGELGYPIGYGLKYCNRFFEHSSEFTESGQNFIKCTGKCLLDQMD